ncbi:MAG: hypothetical protein AAGB30_10940 [Pedobacter sp.]
MALYQLTAYEYRYKITGSAFTPWIRCSLVNSRIDGERIVIFGIPNANIDVNDLEVRIRRIGINTPGEVLRNNAAFVETIPTSFEFYLSNDGNDGNDGLSPESPKQTYSALVPLLANGDKIGLKAGDIFNETIVSKTLGALSAYGQSGSKKAFVIDRSEDCSTGWTLVPGTSNVWEQTFTNGYPGRQYDNNYLIEVTKAIENDQPFTSRKYLTFFTEESDAFLDAHPGSVKIESTIFPMTIKVHTSNSESPNSNSLYSYRRTIAFTALDVADNGSVFNVISREAINGYGPILGNGKVRRAVIQGGSTHQGVMGQVDMEHVVFLNSLTTGYPPQIAFAFYAPDPEGFISRMKNVIFFDSRQAILSHTGTGGGDFELIYLQKVYSFNDQSKPGYVGSSFSEFTNTRNAVIDSCYSDAQIAYRAGSTNVTIINSIFPKLFQYAVMYISSDGFGDGRATINNCLFVLNGADIGDVQNPFRKTLTATHDVQHCIVHANSPTNACNVFAASKVPYNKRSVFKYNIVILDAGSNFGHRYMECYLVESSPDYGIKGQSQSLEADFNVYITLDHSTPLFIIANSPPPSVYRTSLEQWQEWSGQDLNSLYFDLSDDPDGLEKIFVDPYNGNWSFTNDPIAQQIQALGAGMVTPPTSYPTRPTYEEAAENALNAIELPDFI